ncbi:phospholipid-transporting ATPase ABCA1-like [Bombina bombina]|uniref:phospholipid-transporting ATPase ABCA1-like n=1 Tax=Bombina bombina TaxID=8345 RepID=UPI00235AF3E7|nr:phospholipid-transporting ATPase ABCA1-like [Bombina bombina]
MVMSQLRLLLWKNFTYRKRQKVRLLVELLWPLFLFIILVLVRLTNLPEQRGQCHYRNKAMPSAGTLPWIQTIVCNIDNPCLNYPTSGESPGQVNNFERSMITTVFQDLKNVLLKPANMILYQNVFNNVKDIFGNMARQAQYTNTPPYFTIDGNQTDGLFTIRDILKTNEQFTFLMQNMSFSFSDIESIMAAYINPQQIINTPQFIDIKDALCNISELQNYLTFATPEVAASILNTTCSLPKEQLAMLADGYLKNINVTKVIELVFSLGVKNQTVENMISNIMVLIKQMSNLQTINVMKSLNTSSTRAMDNSVAGALSYINMFLCGTDPSEMPNRSSSASSSDNFMGIDILDDNFCSSLISTFENTTSLKFLWNTFKPLLMGKILYTPDNAVTKQIITEANDTFREIDMIKEFGLSWDVYGPIIWQFLQNSSTMNQIRDIFKNPVLAAMADKQMIPLGINTSDIVNFLYNGPPDMRPEGIPPYDWRDYYNYTTSAIKIMTNLLGCLTLDKFEPVSTEWDLVNKSINLTQNKNFWASIVFLDMDSKTVDIPSHIKYKIRMDIEEVESTRKTKERLWAPGARDDSHDDMRYLWGGFAYIQDMIDHGIIRLQTNEKDLMGVFTQQIPYPCYVNDVYMRSLSRSLPLFMTLAWIYSVAMIVKGIVYEKEARLKETVRMMGLGSGTYRFSWFISSFIPLVISAFLLTITLKFGNILRYSDPSVFFVFMVIFCFATIMECFFISVFFSKANLAAACGGIIYFVLYLPHVLLFAWQDYLKFPIKIVVSLLSSVAFGYGCENFSRYEEQGKGLQWSNIRTSPEDGERYSFLVSMFMMLFDGFLYLLLTWYIENIFPGQYGIPKPWYFPFTASYWCGVQVNNDFGTITSEAQKDSSAFSEAEPNHLRQGVSIKNLVKIYKTGKKTAVDGLNVNFYEGQITSFLGHNGAGKTTTMSILTGLFPPTFGTAYIYGKDIRTEMDSIRKDMGMCPQHNVLFDQLTVEEHLYFYAQLKGCDSKQVKEIMETMLEDVGLPHKRKELVKNLSGGMQRKLSIAIAFIGGSKVVILDEPTAGVDPYARRGIWDLLLKFKQGRTIILSTHHMDEADILGDRIAIISHGKLCCCGSSMFLKKCFGSGYFLTLVKQNGLETNIMQDQRNLLLHNNNEDKKNGDESENKENTMQALKPITSLIQEHVAQAQFLQSIGQEITYILPYKGAEDGSFAKLFEALDSQLSKLDISSYGLSDTTLEEIFLKVAEDTGVDKETSTAQDVIKKGWKQKLKKFKSTSISSAKNNPDLLKAHDYDSGSIYDLNGRGSFTVTGWQLIYRQFHALFLKRFHHARRSRKGFIAQVILPAVFVCLSLIFSVIVPPFVEYPSLELQPWMYGPQHSFISNDDPSNVQVSRVIDSLTEKPGFGTRCMKDNPIPNLPCATNGTSDWYSPPVSQAVSDIINNGNWSMSNPSPSCECSTPEKTLMLPECPLGAGGLPPQEKLHNTTDTLQDLTGRNVTDYLLKSYKQFYKTRYGGISVGEINTQNPMNSTEISDLFQQLKTMFNLYESNATDQMLSNTGRFIKELVTQNNVKVWFYNQGWHAVVSFINVANNAILRGNLQSGKALEEYGITTYNHPLNLTKEQLSGGSFASSITDMVISICVIFAMSFIPASFVLFLIQERVTKAKHLQLASGVNPVIYWIANYAWDMCNYIVPCVIVVILFLCFQEEAYVSAQNLPVLILLLILYGWSVTPLMYPASFFFSVPSTAYVVLTCINMFIGINGSVATFVLEMFKDENLKNINDILKEALLIFPHFCLGRGLMDLAKNQAIATAYKKFGEDRFENPFNWNLVGRNLFAMFIEGTGFFLFTLLLQYNFFIKPRSGKLITEPLYDEDEDVANERSRILNGGGQTDLLRICDLSKVYRGKKKPAVNRICVGVPPAECFGLLGINGAGKTTTFKMLTGDISITSGNAFVNGYSILQQMREAHQNMGYCPQFDAIDDLMSGQEHLEFYARLRGVPETEVKKVAEWGIRKLGLCKYAIRSAGTYSGGNKRKLSTAMALIGCPPIIFLDEPTTGMDPKARRFLWDCILSIIKEGRSIVLTSHSMEECEALCTRMAIMVNGNFKCLGSIQHLKNRFGDGYTVIIRVGGASPLLQPVEEFVRVNFIGSVLKEKHHNTLQYQLPASAVTLSKVFRAFTENKKTLNIEDYSVSQTTLDQVFVNFAKHQSEDEQMSHVYINPLATEDSTKNITIP